MYSRETVILDKAGLHARPASEFIQKAKGFSSDVQIKNLDASKQGSAKSIVSILTLGIVQGTKLEISAEGDDEHEAVDALIEFIEINLAGE